MPIKPEENIETTTKNGDNTNAIKTDSGSCDVANEFKRKPSIEEKFISKMFFCSRETICLILAVTFSIAFSALHSVPPKISKPPPAKPFFHQNSIVIDFYKGQLNSMIDRGSDADLNFVMYYAPWDAESQIVRYEFERVAHYYHSKIFFAAINCWHPGSECRNQYSKIHSYPVLVLYPSRGTGIQYKGIYTAPYIMRFLNGFLKPIHRISNQKDLMELLADNDSVLVGFFDFNGPAVSPGYREFYKAAIRALERDPNRDVIFAAVTSAKVASSEFNIEYTPSASLYLWNESLIYPREKLWKSDILLQWMRRSIHKVSLWLQPPGVKSSTLAPYLHDGPVLLLFTPRNPLHPSNYNHDLIREIALEYYSCGDDVLTRQLTKRLKLKRLNSVSEHHAKSKQCLELTADEILQPPPPLPVSISVQRWINDSCCAQVFINKCLLCERDDISRNDVCNIAPSKFNEFCKINDIFNIFDSKDSEEHYSCCDNYRLSEIKDTNKRYISMKVTENDSRSAIAVHLRYIQDDCMNFLAGDKYHYPIFPEELNDNLTVQLDASACNMNRSMAFLSIDSLNYFHFAEGLGIDVLQMRNKTAVVILDSLRESQYLMLESLNRNSLVKFINNYVNGSLRRTLRSDAVRQYRRDSIIDSTCNNKKSSEVCIQELNTKTFLNTVLDPTRDVVVLYHSPYCAFCSAISFVYLTVANLLSRVNNIVFVRIDGDNNDLPWEYSMNRYPSILFFPAKRKDDSTIFPASSPITVPNLLNFVLANLQSDTYIEALINICYKNSGESANNCVIRIRRYCLDVIHNYLKNYRKLMRQSNNLCRNNIEIMNKRREILLKLEHVRDVHLVLSFIDNLNSDTDKYHYLIDKFNIYRNNLEIMKNRTVSTYNCQMNTTEKQKIINDEL